MVTGMNKGIMEGIVEGIMEGIMEGIVEKKKAFIIFFLEKKGCWLK